MYILSKIFPSQFCFCLFVLFCLFFFVSACELRTIFDVFRHMCWATQTYCVYTAHPPKWWVASTIDPGSTGSTTVCVGADIFGRYVFEITSGWWGVKNVVVTFAYLSL